MDANDKSTLLAHLEHGPQALAAAMEGVTEEMAARVPNAGAWSLLGCVEHVAIVEQYLFARLAEAQPSPDPVGHRGREARILARGPDRTTKVAAPENAHPTGRYNTLSEAWESFLKARSATILFVESNTADLRALATTHPVIGPVNAFEMLLMIAIHPLRHAHQIEEIKASFS